MRGVCNFQKCSCRVRKWLKKNISCKGDHEKYNRTSTFYYPGPVFDFKNNSYTSCCSPKKHAQPKGEKKFMLHPLYNAICFGTFLLPLSSRTNVKKLLWAGSLIFDSYKLGSFYKGGKFLKKLWCCVGGEHYKIIWFYQLS